MVTVMFSFHSLHIYIGKSVCELAVLTLTVVSFFGLYLKFFDLCFVYDLVCILFTMNILRFLALIYKKNGP